MIAFDIETGPLPQDQVIAMMPPFETLPHPGDFNEDNVKYGNTKDPTKRLEKLASERAAHETRVANHEANAKAAEEKHVADFMDRAALSPLTGECVCIGYGMPFKMIEGSEVEILKQFWSLVKTGTVVGWNSNGFDLPFLVRRSWKHKLMVPKIIDGRFFDKRFIDLMQTFECGKYNSFVKLDVAAKFLGVGAKTGDGADFAKLYRGTADERKQAIDYLRDDVTMVWKIAELLGV